MKVLLIPDKFKGSLTAKQVVKAIQAGLQNAVPRAEVHAVLASDGGDGFLNAISQSKRCTVQNIETVNPLGKHISADYLLDTAQKSAYIELAKTSGLELLQEEERNAMDTSTFGTGLQIQHAIESGVTTVYIGLGGSATNDAAMGIANALGYDFLDEKGNVLKPIGRNLSKIAFIKRNETFNLCEGVAFFAVNDVNNPLYGEDGAAYTYARQKGASESEIHELDLGLRHLDKVYRAQSGMDCANLPGAGAAGGAAYGLKIFFNAEFISGIDFVLRLSNVEQLLTQQRFDYIITGEGKFDSQTLNGKLMKGVVNLGARYSIPVIAICGESKIDSDEAKKFGLHEVLQLLDDTMDVSYAIANAEALMERTIFNFFSNEKV